MGGLEGPPKPPDARTRRGEAVARIESRSVAGASRSDAIVLTLDPLQEGS
jgi:hypothetical protein